MHLDVLNKDQQELLPLLSKFKKEFYMVGGTAIALHIGHRLSIDFDLFKTGNIRPKKIITTFKENREEIIITLNREGQLNLVCRNVKFTFFNYEFDIPHPVSVEKNITIPSLIDLAAMKAFAMGMRSKWKDYVDLFFIIKDHYGIREISARAGELFETMFSEKLFRGQISYFQNIYFDEPVQFMPGFGVNDQEVKDFLTDAALRDF